MTILIISAACCYSGMAVFDAQAKKVIKQAIEENGMEADVKIIPGVTDIYGGVLPKHVMNDLMKKFSRNETGPAILINGEVVFYGVPKLEDIKVVLENLQETN